MHIGTAHTCVAFCDRAGRRCGYSARTDDAPMRRHTPQPGDIVLTNTPSAPLPPDPDFDDVAPIRPAKRARSAPAPAAAAAPSGNSHAVGPMIAACGMEGLARTLPIIHQGRLQNDGRGLILTLGRADEAGSVLAFAKSCGGAYAELELWVGLTPDNADLRFDLESLAIYDFDSLHTLAGTLAAHLCKMHGLNESTDWHESVDVDALKKYAATQPNAIVVVDDQEGEFARLLAHMASVWVDLHTGFGTLGKALRKQVKKPTDKRFARFLTSYQAYAARTRSYVALLRKGRELWSDRVL